MKPAPQVSSPLAVPPLIPGERLSQKEFHRRYEQYPEDVKFELIGGIVHMASPVADPHADCHSVLGTLLGLYRAMTPGTRTTDNGTIILGEKEEPQPDLSLRILAEYGGQARVVDRYLCGAPELVAEVADSTEAIDLGQKRKDYEDAGVLEYLVACLRQQEIRWFDFGKGKEIRPRNGVYRSRVFPGLWIAAPALLAGDATQAVAVLQQGLASKSHPAFVNRLARAHRRLAGPGGAPSV